MSSNVNINTNITRVVAQYPTLREYALWDVSEKIAELARRPRIQRLLSLPVFGLTPNDLPWLFHNDDSDKLAEHGLYEEMDRNHLRYQCKMRGLTVCNDPDAMEASLRTQDACERLAASTASSPQDSAYHSPSDSETSSCSESAPPNRKRKYPDPDPDSSSADSSSDSSKSDGDSDGSGKEKVFVRIYKGRRVSCPRKVTKYNHMMSSDRKFHTKVVYD